MGLTFLEAPNGLTNAVTFQKCPVLLPKVSFSFQEGTPEFNRQKREG
jgi:hypothetical protein